MREIIDNQEKEKTYHYRDIIVSNPWNFSQEWLANTNAHVIAAENLMHLSEREATNLSYAFKKASSDSCYAITTEYGYKDRNYDKIYEVEPSFVDFNRLNDIYFSEFFLLFSEDQKCVVLFTAVGDFKLLAGSIGFLVDFWGDLSSQRKEFIDFKDMQLSYGKPHDGYKKNFENALKYMDWIDDY